MVPSAASSGVTDARVVAADICSDLRSGELLDGSFARRTALLEPRDRRWVRELVYGMLRRRSVIDAHLEARVRGGLAALKHDLKDLLRLGAAQLLFMDSVPAYAAVAQTVELAKRRHGDGAGRLTNAVLRRLDRERDALQVATPDDATAALALETSHPEWLVRRWLQRWGDTETRALLDANNREAPVFVRPYHVVREQLEAMLESAGATVDEAPLVRDSIELIDGIQSLTDLGAFRQGLFHVQDPASTLVTQYGCVATGSTVADLCAAPGGKAVELSRTAGVVLASDVSPARLARVTDNLRRMEIDNVVVYAADALQPALGRGAADAVLVDAPCTGTGTFRRHPDARWRLKPSDLAVMPALQRNILAAASTCVRPGGLLIYSTCSLEPEENENQVQWFLQQHADWKIEPPPDGAVPPTVLDDGLLRVLPQRHGVDGAFAARLRRGRE